MDILFDLSPMSTTAPAEPPLRFAVGTMTTAIRVRHAGPVDFVGVRFRPGAARPFLSPPASELTDSFLELDDVWGAASASLWHQLADQRRTGDRLRLVKWALRHRMERASVTPNRVVCRAATALLRGVAPDGGTTVGNTAERLGVSRRHLERGFHREVGISPGQLARVGRLRRAARMLSGAPELSLARIAVRAGYHDQPHMTRDFRTLARVTPGAYRREVAAAPTAGRDAGASS